MFNTINKSKIKLPYIVIIFSLAFIVLLLVIDNVKALSPCINYCIDGLEKGDLITSPDHPAVYLYDTTPPIALGGGHRRPFPKEEVYKTYYNDFSGVKTFSKEDIEKIELGKPMPINPGLNPMSSQMRLVKFPFNPKIYYVADGDLLRHIPNEIVANRLFGSGWSQKVTTMPEVYSLFYEKAYGIDADAKEFTIWLVDETVSKHISEVKVNAADSSGSFFSEIFYGQDGISRYTNFSLNKYVNQSPEGYVMSALISPNGEVEVNVDGKKATFDFADLVGEATTGLKITVMDDKVTLEKLNTVEFN